MDFSQPITVLHQQTANAYNWVNTLIEAVPFEKWEDTPDVINSNISWQTGHLITSFYFHTVMCMVGHVPEILNTIPIKAYSDLFAFGGDPSVVKGKSNPEALIQHLKQMQTYSLDTIAGLSPEDLNAALEPTQVTHPVAKTKFEALDWNIKHTMWHCGQIATIRRLVNGAYHFALDKKA